MRRGERDQQQSEGDDQADSSDPVVCIPAAFLGLPVGGERVGCPGLDPIVAAELDELILLLKRAFQMTVIVVTHELSSAFRIADRIAMLYKGSFLAVGNKDDIRSSNDPHVRQFLDRVPNVHTLSAETYLRHYLQPQEATP